MLQVWFEPTIPVFERAKIVHALDRAATVIGRDNFILPLSFTYRLSSEVTRSINLK
jgi:hypothetical protein